MRHVLDQEIGGSNLAAVKSLLGEKWRLGEKLNNVPKRLGEKWNNGLKQWKGQSEAWFNLKISSGGAI